MNGSRAAGPDRILHRSPFFGPVGRRGERSLSALGEEEDELSFHHPLQHRFSNATAEGGSSVQYDDYVDDGQFRKSPQNRPNRIVEQHAPPPPFAKLKTTAVEAPVASSFRYGNKDEEDTMESCRPNLPLYVQQPGRERKASQSLHHPDMVARMINASSAMLTAGAASHLG